MKKQFIPIALLFILLLAACGGSTSETPGAADKKAPAAKEVTHDHSADTLQHDHDHGHDHQHDHDGEHAH